MTTSNDSTSPDCIALPSHLDFARCAELRQAIEGARDSAIAFDAQGVEFLGGAGAELLLAARAEWQAKDLPFQVNAPSAQFLQGMDQLGLPHSALLEGTFV